VYAPGEYERLRNERISRNAAMLESLGLNTLSANIKSESERLTRRDPAVVSAMKKAKEERLALNLANKRSGSQRLATKSYNFSESSGYDAAVAAVVKQKREEKQKRRKERALRRMKLRIERETKRREREREKEIKEATRNLTKFEKNLSKATKSSEEFKRRYEYALSAAERRAAEAEMLKTKHQKKMESNQANIAKFEDRLAKSGKAVEECFPRVQSQSETFFEEVLSPDSYWERLLNDATASGNNNASTTDDDDDDDDDEIVMPHLSENRVKSRMSSNIRRNAGGGPITEEFDEEIDRSWCAPSNKNKSQYVPQAGDKVLYYGEGHRQSLELYPDVRADKLRIKSRVPLYARKENNSYGYLNSDTANSEGELSSNPVLCSVVRVDYEFPVDLSDIVGGDPAGGYMIHNIVTLKPLEPLLLQPDNASKNSSKSGESGNMAITNNTSLTCVVNGSRITSDDSSLWCVRKGKHNKMKEERVKVSVGGVAVNPFNEGGTTPKKKKKSNTEDRVSYNPMSAINKPPPSFQVLFKPSDTPDFIVPASYAINSISKDAGFKEGERVCMNFDGKPFYGVVLGVERGKKSLINEQVLNSVNDDSSDLLFGGDDSANSGGDKDSNVNSMNVLNMDMNDDVMYSKYFPKWENINIEWDDGTISRASSWELFDGNTVKDVDEMSVDYYGDTASITLSEKVKDKLIKVLELCKNVDMAQPFIDDVPTDVAPAYRLEVPVSVCINSMMSSLKEGYYRHSLSLLDDVRRMHDNCIMFNEPGHDITLASSKLCDWCIRGMWDLIVKETEKESRSNAIKSLQRMLGSWKEKEIMSPVKKNHNNEKDATAIDIDTPTGTNENNGSIAWDINPEKCCVPDESWGISKPKAATYAPQYGDVVQYSRDIHKNFAKHYSITGDASRPADLDSTMLTAGSCRTDVKYGKQVWEYCVVTDVQYLTSPGEAPEGSDSDAFDETIPYCLITLVPSSNTPYTVLFRLPNSRDGKKLCYVQPLAFSKEFEQLAKPSGIPGPTRERLRTALLAVRERITRGIPTGRCDYNDMTGGGNGGVPQSTENMAMPLGLGSGVGGGAGLGLGMGMGLADVNMTDANGAATATTTTTSSALTTTATPAAPTGNVVDPAEAFFEVGGPIDIILDRITKGYYRQTQAIAYDIKQAFVKCVHSAAMGDLDKLQVGLHLLRLEEVHVELNKAIPDYIREVKPKIELALKAYATAIACVTELPLMEWVLNLNADAKAEQKVRELDWKGEKASWSGGGDGEDNQTASGGATSTLPKVPPVIRPFFGPGSMESSPLSTIVMRNEAFKARASNTGGPIAAGYGFDVLGVDHTKLPDDPCDYHPVIPSKNMQWPAVKVKVRCDSLLAAASSASAGGKRKADEMMMDGDNSFLEEEIKIPYAVFRQNNSMIRAFYGTENRVKSCFKCRAQNQGFMICRVKRGHSNIDYIAPPTDQEKNDAKKGGGANTPGLRPVKRPDFTVPAFKVAVPDRTVRQEENLANEAARIESLQKEWEAAEEDAKKYAVELEVATKFIADLKTAEIVVTETDIEKASSFTTGAEDGHEELCYVCGEAGILIMCDSCPKCAHFTCVGLNHELMGDDEDWFCKTCSESIADAPHLATPDTTPVKEGGGTSEGGDEEGEDEEMEEAGKENGEAESDDDDAMTDDA
jgi:hypothetical protein